MRRRVLFVLGSSPLKPHSGHLRHRELLNGLAERHHVRVVVHGSDTDPVVESHATAGSWIDALEFVRVGAGSGPPGAGRRAVRNHVSSIIDDWEPHIVIADKDSAVALEIGGDVPVIIDFCDAKSVHHARRLRFDRSPTALGRLAKTFILEQRAARRASAAVFVSDRDRSDLRFLRPPPNRVVVPNGVDVEYWSAARVSDAHTSPDLGLSLVFTGRMNYPPNVDAAVQLCRTILPSVAEHVPGIRAVVAGADPTPEVRALALEAVNVEVTGTVDDLRPYLANAAVFVAPLRFGAGVQNKVLEALAMDLPVVTTPLVAAGLRPPSATTGSMPVCAVEVGDIAECVRVLLTGHDHSDCGGDGVGRDWVVEHFSWPAAVSRLDSLIEELSS